MVLKSGSYFSRTFGASTKRVCWYRLRYQDYFDLLRWSEIERPSFTTNNSEALAKAQKYRKKRQTKKIHAKIKNQRKDWNHKTTFSLAKKFKNIFVGDTSSQDILTEINNINKAIYDASWFELKTLLSYKVLRRQGVFQEVSELYSTETCSVCLVKSGPSGVKSLKIREWTCSVCRPREASPFRGEDVIALPILYT